MTLAQSDIDKINLLIIRAVAQITGDIEETNEKIKDLEDRIRLLPTKDEFLEKMDEVIGKLDKIETEQTIQSHRLSNHEDRIETLEKLHPEIPPSSI